MPSPKKRKPSFDVAASAAPIDTTWVYRTDPEPSRPIAAPAIAHERSILEQAIDWLSRPFGVAIVLSLVPFGGVRRRDRLTRTK